MRSIGPNCERALVDFARRNAGLLVVSLGFAVVAYGYELVNFTPSLDEEVAPTFARLGILNSWNMGIYRWGASALNFAIIGGSNLPFLRLLLALGLLSVTATLYANMLSTTREARYFFCLTFVTVPTFAYALTFSFISIEFVMACLLFVLGLKALVDDGGRRTALTRAKLALVFWIVAPSFYQDYGIVVTAYLVYLFFRIASGLRPVTMAELCSFAGILLASVVLYYALSVAIVWAVSSHSIPYIAGFLATGGARADVLGFLKAVREIYFSNAVYGTRSFAFAALGLPLLSLLSPVSLGRRAALVAISVAICFAPFVYGLGAMPPLRACSGLLFVVAGFCAFAIAQSPPSVAFFVKCFVLYLALGNCVAINNIFQYENLAWEADKALAVNLMQRIYDVAPDVHADDGSVRVLFVGSYKWKPASDLPGTQSWVGVFDTWGKNFIVRRQRALNDAGFPAFRLASKEDYDANLPAIEKMPAWPDARSVARSGDVVVVKLGPANGYAFE